jgi:hypothetical protein
MALGEGTTTEGFTHVLDGRFSVDQTGILGTGTNLSYAWSQLGGVSVGDLSPSATNAVVSFVAPTIPSGSWVNPDATLNSETNDAEVVGIARDNAGNASTNVVFVNIDLTGHPGDQEVEHNQRAPIVIQYGDELSGVDASSLLVLLDTNDISQSFQHQPGRGAIYIPPQDLTVGSHTLEIALSDVAGNETTAEATFTIETSTNGPAISGFNIAPETLMPGTPWVWIQGTRRDETISVSASVNFGPAIPMNTRDDQFG